MKQRWHETHRAFSISHVVCDERDLSGIRCTWPGVTCIADGVRSVWSRSRARTSRE